MLAADQVSKVLVVEHLHHVVHVIDGVLRLRLTRNPGAAFSVGQGATLLFTAIALAVVIALVRVAPRLYSRAWAIDFGLLLGGALGNLADRLARSPGIGRGHVVDWIELPHWPVFNLADSAITIGGVLAVLLVLLGTDIEGRSDGRRHTQEHE